MYTYLHHTTRWAVCLAFVVFCMLLSLFCFFIHWSAIPRSAHRTSETILCLRVTAPTRCVRQDRWFQIYFYFHPYLGKMNPLWLMTNMFQRGWNRQLVIMYIYLKDDMYPSLDCFSFKSLKVQVIFFAHKFLTFSWKTQFGTRICVLYY